MPMCHEVTCFYSTHFHSRLDQCPNPHSMQFRLLIICYLMLIICPIRTFYRHTWRASRAKTTLGPLCNIERSERPCIISWATPLCPLFALGALYKNCFRGANLPIDSYQESGPGKQVVCLSAGLCRLPRQFLPPKEHHSSECRPFYLNQFEPLFK